MYINIWKKIILKLSFTFLHLHLILQTDKKKIRFLKSELNFS